MSQLPRMPKPRPPRMPRRPGYFQSPGPASTDVTVYQGGQAVVREQRTLDLKEGATEVFLEGMPTQFQPDSLMVLGYDGPGKLSLGAISYRGANLDKARILQGSIGKPVTVEKTDSKGKTITVAGTLKAVFGNEAAVERADSTKLFFAPISQVELDEGIPQGLSATPSLMMTPKADTEGKYAMSLLYEAGGLGWGARHSAFYDEKANQITVFETGITLVNGSGSSLRQARLRLLASTNYSNRSRGGLESAMAPKGGARMAALSASPPAQFDAADSVQENVGEAKMYTLDEKVSIADGETKQVVLARSQNVPVKREFFVHSGWYYQAREDEAQKQSVHVRLRMVNDEKHNLGKALPAGEVNIFQYDSSGAPQKIGTGSLGHLAAGEKFKLEFGPSSDVKATRRITDIKDTEEPRPVEAGEGRVVPQESGFEGGPRMSAGPSVQRPRNPRHVAEAAVEPVEPLRFREEERELVIHNYKSEAVEVVVTESVPHNATWLKKPEKHEFVEEAPGSHTMRVSIPASGKASVKYRIRYQTN